MRTVMLLGLLLLMPLAACATHSAKARCEGRLRPINPPAVPAGSSAPASSERVQGNQT